MMKPKPKRKPKATSKPTWLRDFWKMIVKKG